MTTKHYVKWHQVYCKDVSGENYLSGILDIISHYYRGTLLMRILAMPKQRSISFDATIELAHDKIYDSKIGHATGESHWYMSHFIEWLTDIGFHVELTGDEFEVAAASEKAI